MWCTRRIAQLVECLPKMHKAAGSIPALHSGAGLRPQSLGDGEKKKFKVQGHPWLRSIFEGSLHYKTLAQFFKLRTRNLAKPRLVSIMFIWANFTLHG